MTKTTLVMLVFVVACGDTSIEPEPTSASTGTGATGSGGEGGGETAALGYENGERLRARVYVGADGSRQFIGWHDTERGEDCSFARMKDASTRCIPQGAAAKVGIFGDDGCTQELARTTAPCATAPAYATLYESDCDVEIRVFDVGAAVSSVYSGQPGNCNPYTIPQDWAFYVLGDEHAPTDFAEATIALE